MPTAQPQKKPSIPLLCAGALASLLCAGQAQAFSLDDVTAKARALMEKPYAAPVNNLPPVFSGMQFADYQKMQPRADRFEWRDQTTPFRLNFYHQGMHFNAAVRINEIDGDTVQEIRYDPERFDFGNLNFDKGATSTLGYAGFRVLYPINQVGKNDEIMSFLGASYFRVVGKGQVYGLSARGLSIDTAPPGGEEFPDFREFWVQRPTGTDKQIVIYALLDSPRATGAYQFILTPGGKDAVVDVQANVFVRGDIKTLGVAPLTSMFLYGPNQQSELKRNFRPAIHDSNGLAIQTGSGEWLWRPLNNPKNLAISSFTVENPKGFGLLQRGHEFWRYEDLKDRYDLRPSAWIEPQGNWGKGKVTLMEIPTPDETNDNIVAFWTPDEPTRKGQALQFAYRMHWTTDEPALHGQDNAWVRQTFHTDGEQLQANLIRALDGSSAFLVDFEGPVLAKLPPDTPVSALVSVGDNAELLENTVQRNPAIKGVRLVLRVKVKNPALPVEMRAALMQGDKPLSETWSYQVPPNPQAATAPVAVPASAPAAPAATVAPQAAP
ncbi:glucan biosynthesis protein G [Variovorax sp. LT1R16]|uniref:glucan biosynthesis protein G n=1 Tax=Variovorax sp. LT1R16 TaxID=3443728 RepID=UPI003F485598